MQHHKFLRRSCEQYSSEFICRFSHRIWRRSLVYVRCTKNAKGITTVSCLFALLSLAVMSPHSIPENTNKPAMQI